MTNIKKLTTLIHILPWTYAALMFSWEFFIEGHPVRPKSLLIGLYVFYAHLFIFQKYLNRKKYKEYILFLLLILISGELPYQLYLLFSNGEKNSTEIYLLTGSYWADATFFFFNSLIIALVHTLILNTIKKEQLQKQAINTELIYLKSQINPHFLFNTLNNIYSLVYTKAPSAPEAVMRLSSMMRYMLYESNQETSVSLQRELEYLKDFIGLQQLRYKEKDVVDLRISGNIEGVQIAPLLFIDLVENSFKHSPTKLNTGDIRINILIQHHSIVFKCENPVGGNRDNLMEEPGGIGLLNLQKRLQLLYPGKHTLDIDRTEIYFTASLKISLNHKHERKTELLYNR